jgi:hypothetical protein
LLEPDPKRARRDSVDTTQQPGANESVPVPESRGEASASTPSRTGQEDEGPLNGNTGLKKRPRSSDHMTLPQLESRPKVDSKGRTIIYIDDFDFVTMHNLLYFIYTDRVNFCRNVRQEEDFQAEGCPSPADVFATYRAANMYLLERLESRAGKVLINTTTTANICDRLFSIDCKPYENLREAYIKFILKNYEKVKVTEEWEETMTNMPNCTRDEMAYQTLILHEISKKLTGPKVSAFEATQLTIQVDG